MKILLEDLTPSEKDKYERSISPLHPWTPHIDDRTGFSFCDLCVQRHLPWSQNKSVHNSYQINEEIDLPWDKA